MIEVGLTGWGDHPDLYQSGLHGRSKLQVYSNYFSVVEVDSSFYAIQPVRNYERWVEETPAHFSFIVKAFRALTGHVPPSLKKGLSTAPQLGTILDSFKVSLEPLVESQKLKAVLFQFPPWFNCTKENVDLLRFIKREMKDLPCALEFRHQSWFQPEYHAKTLQFMETDEWIHSICDEPQAGDGSVPMVLHPTNPDMTIVRLHGRNVAGWNQKDVAESKDWRDVRYLYNYSDEELDEWKAHIQKLTNQTRTVYVLFNNNSGSHAARNALTLMNMLNMRMENQLDSTQLRLDLF